jgi:hypothetical protein
MKKTNSPQRGASGENVELDAQGSQRLSIKRLEALTLLDLEAGIPEFCSIKLGPLSSSFQDFLY